MTLKKQKYNKYTPEQVHARAAKYNKYTPELLLSMAARLVSGELPAADLTRWDKPALRNAVTDGTITDSAQVAAVGRIENVQATKYAVTKYTPEILLSMEATVLTRSVAAAAATSTVDCDYIISIATY
eukprot:COSAG06_NODE_1679_length_8738_cov_49.835050_3_plen_128_part_00